jgi:hypothetical protein
MSEALKKNDQIRMLKQRLDITDTGKGDGCFTYPDCGYDLVQCGLVTEEGTITKAGRAALWFAGVGPDPTSSSAVETFTIPLKKP